MSISNKLLGTLGVAALGMVGYDSLTAANRESMRYVQEKSLSRLDDVFLRTDSLNTDSTIANKIQNWARGWFLTDEIFSFFDRIGSCVTCSVGHLFDNILSVGLGVLSIGGAFAGRIANKRFLKNPANTVMNAGKTVLTPEAAAKVAKIGKAGSIVGWTAMGLLALKAAHFMLFDVFGLGAGDPRNNIH